MPVKTVKVAVSLPIEEYQKIEKARKQLRISRSAVIREALKQWFAAGEEQKKIRAYLEGYRGSPETPAEWAPFEALASEVLATEEWKE